MTGSTNAPKKFAPLVDTHAHIFMQDFPLVDNPVRTPDYDFPIAKYLATLDQHGVQFAVLSAGSLWGDYNDAVIEATRSNPRLRGTVLVQPSIERYVMDRMKDDGIVGVRLSPIGIKPPPDYDNFEHRRLLRRISDLNWHVHIHVEGERLPHVLPLLERSGARVVLDHLGRIDPKLGVDSDGFRALVAAIERGRTWLKLSAPYRTGALAPVLVKELLHRVGPDRLLWGSDCPFTGFEDKTSYQASIDWLLDCVPNESDRRKLFGENALKLCFS